MNLHIRNIPQRKKLRRYLRKNQTDSESEFWSHVRNKQFYGIKFFRQYSIGKYIIDFYAPKQKLAVEIDGGQHNDDSNKYSDEQRTKYLQSYGIKIIRFWNHDILLNISGVLEELEKYIIITPPNLPLS